MTCQALIESASCCHVDLFCSLKNWSGAADLVVISVLDSVPKTSSSEGREGDDLRLNLHTDSCFKKFPGP